MTLKFLSYLIFSHILAEKLKHATAQFYTENNLRSKKDSSALIGILDTEKNTSALISSTLGKIWNNSNVIQIKSFKDLIENHLEKF